MGKACAADEQPMPVSTAKQKTWADIFRVACNTTYQRTAQMIIQEMAQVSEDQPEM